MMSFFNDTATTEIYTLPLHDALPILDAPLPRLTIAVALTAGRSPPPSRRTSPAPARTCRPQRPSPETTPPRSEEHTSELQSRQYLVCRLLLEKTHPSIQRPPAQNPDV